MTRSSAVGAVKQSELQVTSGHLLCSLSPIVGTESVLRSLVQRKHRCNTFEEGLTWSQTPWGDLDSIGLDVICGVVSRRVRFCFPNLSAAVERVPGP